MRTLDSLKLRRISGCSILLLGVLLFVTSFMPVVLRGGVSPTAGMIALIGLLAIGVGIPLSIATEERLTEGAARRLCVVLESLTFGAAGGAFGFLVQRTSFFDIPDPLQATLVIVFVALLCFAALARVATARQGSAAFRSPSQSLFSFGGSIDPVSFLVLQPSLLLFAAVGGGMIAAQARDGREGSFLALALFLAVLPIFVRAELAIYVKRWRDTTAAWPSYGVLAWAALLALVAFHEIFRWLLSLPGVLLTSSPLPSWPHISLVRVFCFLVSLAACIFCYIASRRVRRDFFLRVFGYVALGLGSLLPISVGLASDGVHLFLKVFGYVALDLGSLLPISVGLASDCVQFAILFVLAAGLIIGALHLLFRRDEKPAVHHAKGTCLDVTSLRSA
jgi:uncharacterized membrane protein YhaH (DUF805 family)